MMILSTRLSFLRHHAPRLSSSIRSNNGLKQHTELLRLVSSLSSSQIGSSSSHPSSGSPGHGKWSTSVSHNSIRYKSTATHDSEFHLPNDTSFTDFNNETKTSKVQNPVPDFSNITIAYDEPKTTHELLRAAICLRLCQWEWLVEKSPDLLRMIRPRMTRLVDSFLKATFYGQFCAGEDSERIQPTMINLNQYGIGSILDYAAENDVQEDESDNDIVTAKTYDYESEALCDKHVDQFLHCIDAVAATTSSDSTTTSTTTAGSDTINDAAAAAAATEGRGGYAAIKVTALGNPKLLARLSTAIIEARRLFEMFDQNQDGVISRDEFEEGYRRYFTDGDDPGRMQSLLDEYDPNGTGYIDYITWSMMLDPKDLPKLVKNCRAPGRLAMACPTDEEIQLLEAMFDRGWTLGQAAATTGTRLLVDAEQVRYQPAIDNLVLGLQRTFNATNVTDRPVIYNTYQCYLKDCSDRLRLDVERSERFGYHFAAKLVRGAYMGKEREWAEDLGLPDPIHDTIDDTHTCYNEAVEYLLSTSLTTENCLEFMCATHNQESIEQAIEVMNRLGIDRRDSTICFAQLYGMSDNLSYNLGKNGYRVFKYLPFGEVYETIEYLLRRVRENSTMMGESHKELSMIKSVLRQRRSRLA